MSTEITPATTTADATVMPSASNLTYEQAVALDRAIDQRLDACYALLHAYLDAGHQLAQMQDTKGFAALGFRTFGKYLESKVRWGSTHLSYLLKLGRAGDSQAFLDLGMKPAVLIHYVKHVSYPQKVQEAIAATWHEVKDLEPKAAETRIKAFVEAHDVDFKKPRKKRAKPSRPMTVSATAEAELAPENLTPVRLASLDDATTAVNWESRFHEQFLGIQDADRKRFKQAMRDFLASCDADAS